MWSSLAEGAGDGFEDRLPGEAKAPCAVDVLGGVGLREFFGGWGQVGARRCGYRRRGVTRSCAALNDHREAHDSYQEGGSTSAAIPGWVSGGRCQPARSPYASR